MTFAPPSDPERRTSVPQGRVLVIAPHPDDETIGPGGTLRLHALQGDPITAVFIASGIGGDPDGHFGREALPEIRRREADEAARRLGIRETVFLGYPDNLGAGDFGKVFGDLPSDPVEARRALVHGISTLVAGLVDAHRPDVVYYPWDGELNPDHWMVGQGVRNLLAVDQARRDGASWLGYEVWAACPPDTVVDVSDTMGDKLKAVDAYASQLIYRDYAPHVRGLAAYRALLLEAGASYGEAFTGRYRGADA